MAQYSIFITDRNLQVKDLLDGRKKLTRERNKNIENQLWIQNFMKIITKNINALGFKLYNIFDTTKAIPLFIHALATIYFQ